MLVSLASLNREYILYLVSVKSLSKLDGKLSLRTEFNYLDLSSYKLTIDILHHCIENSYFTVFIGMTSFGVSFGKLGAILISSFTSRVF